MFLKLTWLIGSEYERCVATQQSPFYVELGKRIRTLRLAAKLSQLELSRAVNVSRPSIANIEKGRQPVYVHTLLTIADVLGTTLDALLPTSAATEAVKVKPRDIEARKWFESLNAAEPE